MPVSDLFERARAERPDHPAVVDGDGSLTYAELGTDVDRAAGWLRAQGIAPGSGSSTPVATTAPSSPSSTPPSVSAPSSSPSTPT